MKRFNNRSTSTALKLANIKSPRLNAPFRAFSEILMRKKLRRICFWKKLNRDINSQT